MDENPLEGIDINELLDPQRYRTTLNEAKANWQNRLSQFKVDLDVLELSLEELPPEGEEEKKEVAAALLNLRKQVRTVAVRLQVINRKLEEAQARDDELVGKRTEKQKRQEEQGD